MIKYITLILALALCACSIEAHAATSNGDWWHPHPGTSWAIQYSGKLDTSLNVQAYDLDLVDVDESVIQDLHAKGKKIICYFSAGSYEGWRQDARDFPKTVLGRAMVGWKDEKWLDIRQIKLLKPIMEARIKLAKDKGCDAIDPDNVEGFDNPTGFPISEADQIAYNRMLAELSHSMGMAAGLKNDTGQIDELVKDFDFQVNEQCFEQDSCKDVVPFIKAGKPVFGIEYKGDPAKFCPKANAMNFDTLKKNLELDAWVKACR